MPTIHKGPPLHPLPREQRRWSVDCTIGGKRQTIVRKGPSAGDVRYALNAKSAAVEIHSVVPVVETESLL